MMGIPVGLLIRIGLALAIAAALAYAWHKFTDHYREQGRAEVRAAWDAEKAAQEAATAAQEAAWAKERAKVDRTTKERDHARREAFAAAAARERLEAEVAGLRVPAPVVDSLRTSTDAANASGTAGSADQTAKAAPAAAGDTTLGAIADWYREVAEIHAEARDRVAAWAAFYAGLRAGQPEGAP